MKPLRADTLVRRATVRLTILNSAVLLGVVVVFALAVNWYVSRSFDLELADSSEEMMDRAVQTLRTALLIGCGVLVVLVPPISYALARLALAPVRRNLEAQHRFVDDASHELRTPVAVAQGELELALMRPRSAEEYRAAIASALSAVEDIGSLSGELLLLAQSEPIAAGTPGTERIGLDELGRRAVLAAPPDLRSRIELAVSAQPDRIGEVSGRPELLVRAIVNLLENAGKYAPPGTPIGLLIEPDGETARISVSDRGPRMSAEDARHAFDRFWRADAARSTPGRGIGLSIVRRIAELHGGRAQLHSAPGRGTTVTIEIPRRSE